MLQTLHIENIAVIEEADISFDAGFNALTGETGAGKSIVIDAMGAVLGQRTSRELIRTGAAKAFVSPALPALEECGLSADEGELLLQREIYADGKNACRVSGRPVTVAQLRRIGSLLWHVRTSNVLGNRPPREGDGEDYAKLFRTLREMNYPGRVTCEAPCASPEEAKAALACLRKAQAEAQT